VVVVLLSGFVHKSVATNTSVATDGTVATDSSVATGSRESLYRQLCASCHGLEGRGDGPAAEALTPRPTDLTKDRSSVSELMRVIDGRRTVRAHGTAAMPVWGRVFEQALIDHPRQRRLALQQVQRLAEYVQDLRK
jgi:mono/diheme cytochrome c family protein